MFPEVPVSAVLGDTKLIPTTLHRDDPIDGNVSPYELEVIATLVAALQPKVLFEIGTFDGRTSLNMAANAPPGSTVYTLDLPADRLNSTAFKLEVNEDIYVAKPRPGARLLAGDSTFDIVQLLGDSASFDFSPFHGRVDFMFIDGSHAYEYVKSDTLNALRMVREGGVIIWHDFVRKGFTPFPGVPRALSEFYLTDGRFRDLKQITGTSILHLRIPVGKATSSFEPILLGDSSKPDHLCGALAVTAIHVPGSIVRLKIAAKNTGAAVWLPSDAPLGPVRLGARVQTADGLMIDNEWRADLPFRRAIFPGEIVELDAEIAPPRVGNCILDFDLVAEGVTWFNAWRGPPIHIPEDTVVLAAQVRSLTQDLESARREISAIHASTSWRLTKPLRAFKGLLSRTASAVGGGDRLNISKA